MHIESKFNELFLPIRNALENAEMAFAEACRRQLLGMDGHIVKGLGIRGFTRSEVGYHGRSVAPHLGGDSQGIGLGFRPNVSFRWYYLDEEVTEEQLVALHAYLKTVLPLGFVNPAVKDRDGLYFTCSLSAELCVQTR